MELFIIGAVVTLLAVLASSSSRSPKSRRPTRAGTRRSRSSSQSKGTRRASAPRIARPADSLHYIQGRGDSTIYVYLVANDALGWMKVGAGKRGRIFQYFSSTDSTGKIDRSSEWALIAMVPFSSRAEANTCKEQVLQYWKSSGATLGAPLNSFGHAWMMTVSGEKQLVPISGEHEAARSETICEHCAHHLIQMSAGRDMTRRVRITVYSRTAGRTC